MGREKSSKRAEEDGQRERERKREGKRNSEAASIERRFFLLLFLLPIFSLLTLELLVQQ